MLPRNRSRSGVRGWCETPARFHWTCTSKLTGRLSFSEPLSKIKTGLRRACLAATLLSTRLLPGAIRRISPAIARSYPICLGAPATPPRPCEANDILNEAGASAQRGDDLELPCSLSQESGEQRGLRSQGPHASTKARLRQHVERGIRSSGFENDARAVEGRRRRAQQDSALLTLPEQRRSVILFGF
jgi:hypothetical protein